MKNKLFTPVVFLAIQWFFCPAYLSAQEHARFTVQVTTRPSEGLAKQRVAGLTAKGLSAFYTVYHVSESEIVYRINVGHLTSRAKARQFRQTLISKYHLATDSFVRELTDEAISDSDMAPVTGIKIHTEPTPLSSPMPRMTIPSTPLTLPTPVPTPGQEPARPNPSPTGELNGADGAVPLPSPLPAPSCVPTPTVTSDAVKTTVTSPKTRSSFSVVFAALADATNYTVNFPAGYGATGVQNTLTSTPLVGGGFGILPTLKISSLIDIQSGLMMFQRTFNVVYNNGLSPEPGVESFSALQVPLMFLFNVFDHFALGAGGYIITNPAGAITQSTFGGPVMPDSNLTGSDWGLTASLQFSVEMGQQTDLVLSALYNYGNGNWTPVGAAPEQVFSDYQLLAGLRFYFAH